MSWAGIISICETDSLWELLRQNIFGFQNHCRWWWQPWNWKTLAPWKKAMRNLNSILKSRDIILLTKFHIVKAIFCFIFFFSSHVWMWKLEHKEGWVKKNGCSQTVVLEKTFESPLDCNEIKPVNPKVKWTLNIQWKDWCWSWSSNTLATWCDESTH